MVSAALICASALTSAAPAPTVCLSGPPPGQPGSEPAQDTLRQKHALFHETLLAALRARIARPQLLVRSCSGADSGAWRVSVQRSVGDGGSSDEYSVAVSGVGIDGSTARRVDGRLLAPEELAQVIALTVVEIIGPSLEKLLGQMGDSSAPDQLDRALAVIEGRSKEPSTQGQDLPKIPRLRWSLDFDVGPSWVSGDGFLTAFGNLRGVASFGPLSLFLGTGFTVLPARQRQRGRISGWALDLAVGLRSRWHAMTFGLSARNRFSRVTFRAGSDGHASSTLGAWRGGLGVDLAHELARWRSLGFSVAADLGLWPQPERFLVAESTVWQPSFVDVGLSLRITLLPASPVASPAF